MNTDNHTFIHEQISKVKQIKLKRIRKFRVPTIKPIHRAKKEKNVKYMKIANKPSIINLIKSLIQIR